MQNLVYESELSSNVFANGTETILGSHLFSWSIYMIVSFVKTIF